MTSRTYMLAVAGIFAAGTATAQEATTLADSSSTFLLDRVVVTAGEEKVAVDAPQSISVVDQEDFDAEQPTTIGDVLNDLPGVKAIGSDRVLGESFNIRGFGTLSSSDEYRIIVNVDGAQKFHEQYRLGSLFTDPELYKRAEVLRGPASSTLYGSGALAGVISLETKDPSDFLREGEKFTLREKLEFHSNTNGFLTSTIVAAEPVENLQLMGTINYRRAQQFEDGDGNKIIGSHYQVPSGLVKGTYKFGAGDAHKLKVSYQHWESDEEQQQFSQTDSTTGFGYIDRKVVDQTAIVGYSYNPQNNRLIDLDTTLSYVNSSVEQRNTTQTASTSDLYADGDYNYETVQLNAKNSADFSGENYENFLITGVDMKYHTRTADNLRDADGKVTFHPGGKAVSIGVYAQNEWVYRDRLTLIPGIRVDWQKLTPAGSVTVTQEDVTRTAVSPKLAAHYKIDDIWGVFGSVAYTERMPVIDEVYDNSSSNTSLDPEKSLNYEAGFSAQFDNVAQDRDRAAGKVTTFYNDISDLIERDSSTLPFHNVGKARIMGVEVEASYDSRMMFGRAAYTFMRGENTETNESLPSIPADELVLTVGGRVPEHDIEYGWRGVFARHQLKTSGSAPLPTGGYAVHDLFASWKPDEGTFKDGEVRFGVENVFNKNYREHLGSDSAKGRTFKLTLAKQF